MGVKQMGLQANYSIECRLDEFLELYVHCPVCLYVMMLDETQATLPLLCGFRGVSVSHAISDNLLYYT